MRERGELGVGKVGGRLLRFACRVKNYARTFLSNGRHLYKRRDISKGGRGEI